MTELGCDYRGMDFGARYIDSCCIDGFLWDLDSGDGDSLSVGGDVPCPQCNHEAWISYISDVIEFRGYLDFEKGKTIEDCPFFAGCSGLRFPDDWEIYKGFWLKGFADAKKEGEIMLELTLDEAIKHCKENVQKETQNGNLQCAAEHNQLAIWLSQLEESKSKAAAYDRLMSGGKKTLKEIANFLGNPVAVDREGRLLWSPKKPEIGLFKWIWYDKYLPKNIFDYTGDWKDSLTLPDGWEES